MPETIDAVDVAPKTDEALFAEYVTGDQSAFTQIVKRHMPRLVVYFRRQFRDQQRVEDLCQETFFALHKCRENFDPSRNLLQWLFSVASRRAADLHRSMGRHPVSQFSEAQNASGESSTADQLIPGDEPEPLVAAEERESAPMLRAAIETLADEERQALQLVCFDGLTYVEAADVMHMPIGTVKTRVRCSKLKLRQLLETKFGFSVA